MRKNTRVRGKRQPLLDDFLRGINHFWGWARLHVPLYLLAAGLAVAYSWGWLSTYPGVFGWALAAGAVTAAFLLPALGDVIEDKRIGTPWKANAAFGIVIACMAFNILSEVVAYNAAEAPQKAFLAGQAAVADAEADVIAARAELTRFECSRDMPASRCEVFRATNAGAEARALGSLAVAEQARADAERAAAPAPSVAVPAVHWIVKVLLGLAFDVILFVTPWAARAERDLTVAVAPVVERKVAEPAPGAVRPVPAVKVNDGGWAARRAKYGPTGQRSKKRGLHVIKGGR